VLIVRRDHVREARCIGMMQHVRQQHRERLVADDIARAPHRMPEPERCLLSRKTGLPGLRQILHERFEFRALAPLGQGPFELELAVEVVLDDALVAPGDEDEMLDPGGARLVDHVLYDRAIDDGQHFLGDGLRRGEKAGPEAGDGKYGLADGSRRACHQVGSGRGQGSRAMAGLVRDEGEFCSPDDSMRRLGGTGTQPFLTVGDHEGQ
jgi:hypothetical protein